jgi:hypothetical protein
MKKLFFVFISIFIFVCSLTNADSTPLKSTGQPIRKARCIGLSFTADLLYSKIEEIGLPLPGFALDVNPLPNLSFQAKISTMGLVSVLGIGAKVYFSQKNFSPYVYAGAGFIQVLIPFLPDEIYNIPELRYGAGIEYVTNNGFLVYWEIGATSWLGEESTFIFGQTTIGLGYRFKCKK